MACHYVCEVSQALRRVTLSSLGKSVRHILTEDLRTYLTEYQSKNQSSRVTIDNIRRILSSFFSWLEDEDYIVKSPVRRIHKVKTASSIKETYSDEELERMRDNCEEIRDLAMIDMLASTGMRVGEMVLLNRDDINFAERECVVFGKGDKERMMKDWENVKLGSVCEVVRGGSPRPIIDYITNEPEGVNWLKIGDVKETDKFFTHANEKIKPSGILKTREVKAGDLILSNSMSFGRAFITLIDGYIHDGWLRLRCDEGRLDKPALTQKPLLQ